MSFGKCYWTINIRLRKVDKLTISTKIKYDLYYNIENFKTSMYTCMIHVDI